jgi:hypothetical protein
MASGQHDMTRRQFVIAITIMNLYRPNPAPSEHGPQQVRIRATVQVGVGIDDGARAAREGRKTIQLEVADQIWPFSCSPL